MEHGWFRGWVLYLDGELAAFWHGERYAGSSGPATRASTPRTTPTESGRT